MIDVRKISYGALRVIIDRGQVPGNDLYKDAQREMNRRVKAMVDSMPSRSAASSTSSEEKP